MGYLVGCFVISIVVLKRQSGQLEAVDYLHYLKNFSGSILWIFSLILVVVRGENIEILACTVAWFIFFLLYSSDTNSTET